MSNDWAGFGKAINRVDPGHTGLGQPDGMILVAQQTRDAFVAAGYDPALFTVTDLPEAQVWVTDQVQERMAPAVVDLISEGIR